MLKLKLQYFGHLTQRANTLEKTLMLGKTEAEGEEGDRGWDGWIASQIWWTRTWANSRKWWGTGKADMMKSTGSWRVRHNLSTKQQLISPGGLDGIQSACNEGDLGLIPGLGRNPGEGNGNPFQHAEFHGQRCLAGYTVHGVAESDTTEWLTFKSTHETSRICTVTYRSTTKK